MKLEECSLYCFGVGKASCKYETKERFYELYLITAGEGQMVSSDNTVPVKKGDIYISFPFEKQKLVSNDGCEIEYDYLNFSVHSKRFASEFNRFSVDYSSTVSHVLNSEELSKTIRSICKELELSTEGYSYELVSLFCSQMLVYIMRIFGERSADDYNHCRNDFGLCGMVMNYIDQNVGTMKSLKNMASDIGYNYSYLSYVFRKTTGTTLNSYYKSRRMDAARTLLDEGGLSVSKVAELMNYSTVYAFSKAFKEYFGISPSKYLGKGSSKE